MMLERLIYRTLQQGVAMLAQNPDIVDCLYGGQLGLGAQEVQAIQTFWADEELRPNVVHGYATSESDFPVYAIVLAQDQEEETYLGDEVEPVLDEDDEEYQKTIYGSTWNQAYHVLCYSSGSADVAIYMYHAARYWLVLDRRRYVNEEGLWGVRHSGLDLQPDPAYLPAHLFVRQLTVQAKSEFNVVDQDSLIGRAWAVAGIHLDSRGSQSSVGGVKTLITVPGSDED